MPALVFSGWWGWGGTHLGVAGHDGVVAVVIQGGGGGVQGAGAVGVAADPVVFAPLGDLLPVFEPIDLRRDRRDSKIGGL